MSSPETTICWTIWNMERGTVQISEFLRDKTILRAEFLWKMWAIKLTIEGAHDVGMDLHAYYCNISGDVQEKLF